MLRASFFLLIAVILSAFLAFGGISSEGAGIGKVLLIIFGLMLVASLVAHVVIRPLPESDRIPTDEG